MSKWSRKLLLAISVLALLIVTNASVDAKPRIPDPQPRVVKPLDWVATRNSPDCVKLAKRELPAWDTIGTTKSGDPIIWWWPLNASQYAPLKVGWGAYPEMELKRLGLEGREEAWWGKGHRFNHHVLALFSLKNRRDLSYLLENKVFLSSGDVDIPRNVAPVCMIIYGWSYGPTIWGQGKPYSTVAASSNMVVYKFELK